MFCLPQKLIRKYSCLINSSSKFRYQIYNPSSRDSLSGRDQKRERNKSTLKNTKNCTPRSRKDPIKRRFQTNAGTIRPSFKQAPGAFNGVNTFFFYLLTNLAQIPSSHYYKLQVDWHKLGHKLGSIFQARCAQFFHRLELVHSSTIP